MQIVGTRWVFTEKANGAARARLVVQGCQEKINDIRSDSPTGSRDCFTLTLIHAAQRGWSVSQFDDWSGLRLRTCRERVSTEPQCSGCLDGIPLLDKNRAPWRSLPAPFTSRKMQGGIGTYMRLRKHLQKGGFFESRLEKGTYCFHIDGKLACMIHTHVDDLLIARQTDCPVLDTTIAKLTKDLHVRKSEGDVPTYLGRRIELKKDEIRVTRGRRDPGADT